MRNTKISPKIKNLRNTALAMMLVVTAACNPQGNVENVQVTVQSNGNVSVSGWAYDSDAPTTPVIVALYVDGVGTAYATANKSRPDVASAKNVGPKTGFSTNLALQTGSRNICVTALNVPGTHGDHVELGCKTVQVHAAVAQQKPKFSSINLSPVLGTAPHQTTVTWNATDNNNDALTCSFDWGTGSFSETVNNCQGSHSHAHVFENGGTYAVRVRVNDNKSGSTTWTKTVEVTNASSSSDFNIEVVGGEGFSPSQLKTLEDAVGRWESVITNDLPRQYVTASANECGDSTPAINGFIDDLRINVLAKPIDGVGGTLGRAGPCYLRPGSLLPALGVMNFDSADLDRLETQGRLRATFLHEMGHVLGIGTLWEPLDLISGITGNNPRFKGVAANNQWNIKSGESTTPIEAGGSSGTALGHWRETDLGDELMTGYLTGSSSPLSSVTIGSLQDLGYAVDFSKADPFVPPPAGGLPELREHADFKLIELGTNPKIAGS